MSVLSVFLIALVLSSLIGGIWFSIGFKKAGKPMWVAFTPIYGLLIILRIIKRPWWWVFLFWIPIVNNIMLVVLFFEWLRMFGYSKKRYTLISLLTFGVFLMYASQKGVYTGDREDIQEQSITGWIGSVMFAVVAATIVHTYLIQPFIIPTSSLEKTLLVGDFLFVSKFHYGARLPMTPLSFPMVHDTLPLLRVKSYSKKWKLPYMRLPGFEKIERNDIVVFSWPIDTVRFFHDPSKIRIDKPIDKKSNYVKRCVGLPGDTLSVRDGYVYINNKKNILPDRSKLQFAYTVEMKDKHRLSEDYMYNRFDVTDPFFKVKDNVYLFYALTEDTAESLTANPKVKSVRRYVEPRGYHPEVFPHSPEMPWSVDQYGPLYIPKKGATVSLTIANLPLYKQIITNYEDHQLETEGLQIKLDGKPVDSYTFSQDYYWMMGDNRSRSEDSEYWGFVPENHIVGKPIFVWMSIDWSHGIKIRWDRLFTTVSGEGKPISFFRYFVIALALWYVIRIIIRKKRLKK